MSAEIKVVSTGWDEVEKYFTFLTVTLENDLPLDSIVQIGNRVLEILQEITPVKTGALKASWKMVIDQSTKSVLIGSDLDYSVYVELGTSKMQAHPSLMPALLQALNEFKQKFPDKVRRIMEQ